MDIRSKMTISSQTINDTYYLVLIPKILTIET